ncbi:MAG: DNA-directed RNA polymerase subunit omega [Nitrospirae bacterium]|nr:MAG: DNA-directed RNA polymerase subunit omega [Nitrospirota bacterium]
MAILEPLKIIEEGKEDNLYRLCHLVVQRARQIQEEMKREAPSLLPSEYKKPTSRALEEFLQGKIRAYTPEEWAEEEARRAAAPAEPAPPVEEVPVSATPAEDFGGFAGFLERVMRAEPKPAAEGAAPASGEAPASEAKAEGEPPAEPGDAE